MLTGSAKAGCRFKEIAGNHSAILLTVLVPSSDSTVFENTQVVFRQPVASDLSMQRIALATPVPQLSQLLVQLDKAKTKIEHVFDF